MNVLCIKEMWDGGRIPNFYFAKTVNARRKMLNSIILWLELANTTFTQQTGKYCMRSKHALNF